LLPLLFALISLAEFLHVEQSVTGLDCISCAESAPKNLKKIKGVDSASFRTKDSVAVLELKPGNTVTLGEIRDAVKRMGYTPAGAKVTVRGEARKDGAKWILHVAGSDAEYPLDVSAGQAIRESGITIIEGSLVDPAGPLKVSAAKPGE
jgi:cation transport ATPase